MLEFVVSIRGSNVSATETSTDVDMKMDSVLKTSDPAHRRMVLPPPPADKLSNAILPGPGSVLLIQTTEQPRFLLVINLRC
jgi:hypothetical protein